MICRLLSSRVGLIALATATCAFSAGCGQYGPPNSISGAAGQNELSDQGNPAPSVPRLIADATTSQLTTSEVKFASVERRFALENGGRETLVFRKITTSCGCTSANLTRESLAFGEKCELVLSTRPSRTQDGEVTVTLETNDLLKPHRQFSVIWKAEASIELRPVRIALGRVKPGSTNKVDFEIATLHLDADQKDAALCHLLPKPVLQENAGVVTAFARTEKGYSLEFAAGNTPGRYTLAVYTDPGKPSSSSVSTVEFEVAEMVEFETAGSTVRLSSNESFFEKDLLLSSPVHSEFSITKVVTVPEDALVTSDMLQSPQGAVLRVALKSPQKAGLHSISVVATGLSEGKEYLATHSIGVLID